MTEQQRGVTVTAILGPHEARTEHLDTGAHVEVAEGHLFVRDAADNLVAVYPPASWGGVRVYPDARSLADYGAALLRDVADLVDRGPVSPLPPSVLSALLREKADDLLADRRPGVVTTMGR